MFRFPNLCILTCALCGQAAPFVYPRRSAFSWPDFSAFAARLLTYSRAFSLAFLLLAGLAIPGLAQTAIPAATFLSFNAAQIGVSGGSAQTLTASFAVSGYAGSFTPTAILHYGKDYTLGAVSCSGGAPETCTVPVTFQPTLPGTRKDAIFLMNGTTRLATVLLNGVGQGPMSLVQPGAFTTSIPSSSINTSGYNYIYQSVADENGTVYLLPSGNANFIVSVTKAGVTTQIPLTHSPYFWSIGIDGAGVLYLFGESAKVLTYDTVQGIQGVYDIPNPGTDTDWYPGVVGGDGSIYVVDEGRTSDTADEFKPDGSAGNAYTISPSINQIFTATLDSAGDFFVGGYTINEITAGGVQTQVNTVGASDGLAVDAADTLYATRYTPTNGVAELPASNYSTAIASIDAHSSPLGVSLGSDGTVFVSNYVNLDVFDRSTTETIDFGEVSSTQSKMDSSATIYNGGNVPLTISDFALTGAGFNVDSTQPDDCISGMVLNPGALCLVTTTFTPGHAGVFSGTITIQSNSLNQTNLQQTILLTGTSDGSYDVLSPNPLTFSSQAVGTSATLPVTMTNQGNSYSSTIYSINVDNTAFTVSNGTCATATGPGANCQLQVTFKPTAATSYTGTATIITYVSGTSLPSQTLTLTLNGAGTGPVAATPVIAPGTGSYTSSQQVTITDATANATIYYTADGSAPTSASTQYTSAITVSSNETLKAVAMAAGYSQSTTATATYTFVYPAVTLTPASVAFGNQTVNTTSGAQAVTLTNSGAAALAITSIALTGANASSFTQTNTCGAALAAGASCNISITFAPASVASYTAALAVTDNASGSPHTVALSGSGTAAPAPVAVLTPASLNFGSVAQTVASAAQTATLKNTGNAALTISSIAITGANLSDFAQTNNCGASLAPGISCQVSVTFTPASAASFAATLVVTDNAAGSPHQVALTGSGIVQPPVLTISPATLNFGNQVVNTNSAAKSVTVTNISTTDSIVLVTFPATSSAAIAAVSPDCGSPLAPGKSCTISVTFAPSAIQAYSGTVILKPQPSGCGGCVRNYPTQTITVTGTGIAQPPAFAVSSSSIAFSNQIVGTTSANSTVTLTNTTSDIIKVQAIASSDPAFATNASVSGCELGLTPGVNCSFWATFSPTAIQPYSATLTVQARDISNPAVTFPPQTITVTGTGIALPPLTKVTPATLDFGSVPVNTISRQFETITNVDTNLIRAISATSSDPAFVPDLTASGFCALQPGKFCLLLVNFTPTAIKSYSATITYTFQDSVHPNIVFPAQTFNVTGSGISPKGVMSLSSTSLNFGNQAVDSISAAQSVTLTNTSTDTVLLNNVAGDGGIFLSLATSCHSPVAPGANCTLPLVFSPTAVQAYNQTITFTLEPVNCGGCVRNYPVQAFTVTGTGTPRPPVMAVSPATASFGNQEINRLSVAQTVTITNVSKTDTIVLPSAGFNPSDPAFIMNSANCAAPLVPGASCAVSVALLPSSLNTYSATVTLQPQASGCGGCVRHYTAQTLALTGTGIPQTPVMTIAPAALDFGTQIANATVAQASVTLTNTSKSESIKLASISSSDSAFGVALGNCANSVAPGASCTLPVTFTPAAAKSYSTTISFQPFDSQCLDCYFPTQSLSVTGTGIAPVASLSPASLSFSTTMGTTSAPQTAILSNTGSGPLSIFSISFGGANPNNYSQTNNCPLLLDVGANCTISATFTPPSLGSYPATVVINDNDPSSPQTITLTGTGVNIPDFAVASSIPLMSVPPGGSAQFSITVSAQNGASIPAVNLSATGLPPDATASFTKSSITPGSTSATTTLTIHTQQTLAGSKGSTPAGPVAALALLAWFFVPRTQRRRWITLGLLLIASLGGISALTGCSGGLNLVPVAKTYAVTVTATIGAVQQTTTIQLTVE